MRNILIDPVLVILPDNATTQEEKIEYLKYLDLLYQAARETGDEWHFSRETALLLDEQALFPSVRSLQRLLNQCNIDINIRQIAFWLSQLFTCPFDDDINIESESLEEALASAGYSLLDVQSEQTTFQPEQFALRWPDFLQPGMKRLFARLCACSRLEHEYAAELLITTWPLLEQTAAEQVVRVSTIIDYISAGSSEDDIASAPVSHDFPLLFPGNDLLPEMGNDVDDDIWKWDGTKEGLCAAIDREYNNRYRTFIEEKQRNKEVPGQFQMLPRRYTFGSHFIKDLKKVAKPIPYLARKVAEAAAAVIADQAQKENDFKLKQFLESESRNSAQRTRGKDKAWRIHVTSNRGGWRLNYWLGPDSQSPDHERIEFSVIQKKEEEPKIYYD